MHAAVLFTCCIESVKRPQLASRVGGSQCGASKSAMLLSVWRSAALVVDLYTTLRLCVSACDPHQDALYFVAQRSNHKLLTSVDAMRRND